MRPAFRVSVLCFGCCALFAFGQDEPSLGDAARQARQQKQQKGTQVKDGQSKDAQAAKAQKVVTNDEIPEHPQSTTSSTSSDQPGGVRYSAPSSGGGKMAPEQWKSQILAQKNAISSMQTEVDKLNDSIHFAPANCVANCAQWNQRQREKQQEVERLQAQLEDQKKRLEDMQESARQQGYGSSVYDP
jgi:hypothetical protein